MAIKLPNELINEIILNLPFNYTKWNSLRVSSTFNFFLGNYMTEEKQKRKLFRDQVHRECNTELVGSKLQVKE